MNWLPFTERIKTVRLDHGLSMKAMAESVGVTGSTWSNYEKDITFPSPSTCWNIQCVYHVKEEWLMTGGGDQYEAGYKPGDPLGEKSDYMEKLKRDAEELMKRYC